MLALWVEGDASGVLSLVYGRWATMEVHSLRAYPWAFRYTQGLRGAPCLRGSSPPFSMARIKKPPPKPVPRAHGKGLSAAKATRELEELNRVGIALSETRDVEQLLDLILKKAREITAADAGSLYLVENGGASGDDGLRIPQLRFKLTQNDSVQFPFSEHTLPLTEDSMAGYCALHGEVIELADAYRVPKAQPFHFNTTFDEQSSYRTRSLITLPMKNGKHEVLVVLD